MDRRGFFTSLLRSKREEGGSNAPLLLPYIVDSSLLPKLCPSCEAPCAKACEEEIITIDKGIPRLSFKERGCTFCQACALACPKGVLDASLPNKLNAEVSIDVMACLAWQKTLCASCKEVCDEGAIIFLGLFRPEIAPSCTACGRCVGVCPTQAISLTPLPLKEES
ncbi:MAG: 4Fe-4S binding protein [Wolinella succinogenes]|uniref:4Fe-4S dicluster domain-containing protein n=1 Tax=Wolinella succinogenes TaxID=844 RepID=UPI00169B7E4C|nr:4Fe-4S dicluster domain-containing protein [Wolinella succinogenes]NLU35027.1 4Fe-4S binding protein [Wolinella succinogenes]